MEIKEKLTQIPDQPGVYLMHDKNDEIIYIGKAKNLKKRVNSYFQKKDHDIKTKTLVRNITNFEFIVTDSEIEAFLLENNLIKKYKPKFNILLKDDKTYPYIVVTTQDEYPRLIYTRNKLNKKNAIFGPYTDANAAKETVHLLNKIFQLKTCNKKIPLKKDERPCLNFQIKQCSGVCQNKISKEEYGEQVKNALNFLKGNIDPVLKKLNKQMKNYAENQEYEKAALMRDTIFSIQHLNSHQKVANNKSFNNDYINFVKSEGEAVIIIFEFRNGILLGRKIQRYEQIEISTDSDILQNFILDFYKDKEIPLNIVLPTYLKDQELLISHLSKLKKQKIKIKKAKSSDDQAILAMIKKNLDIIVADKNAWLELKDEQKGLKELKEKLHLPKNPEYMVCFDISNIQGTYAVASMAAFTNGLPNKKLYRKFKIRGYDQANDPAMIHEAVARFLQMVINENLKKPDLIIIDGGPTQLTRAQEAAEALDIEIKIISIAKRYELLYENPKKDPLVLSHRSASLKIIQNIRDETHRFGITYHRHLRNKGMLSSEFDKVKGIGPTLKSKIYQQLEKNPAANKEDFLQIKGINEKMAEKIMEILQAKRKN